MCFGNFNIQFLILFLKLFRKLSMIIMWARILIFDSNLTKIKYGNRVVETYLSLGIKQFTSKNYAPILWIFTFEYFVFSLFNHAFNYKSN